MMRKMSLKSGVVANDGGGGGRMLGLLVVGLMSSIGGRDLHPPMKTMYSMLKVMHLIVVLYCYYDSLLNLMERMVVRQLQQLLLSIVKDSLRWLNHCVLLKLHQIVFGCVLEIPLMDHSLASRRNLDKYQDEHKDNLVCVLPMAI